MADAVKSTDVAERLRALQTERGLTIHEMAERCGLPKRSLENYMNLKDPQRPGVDALIGIADGMSVSIDWLVGRGDDLTRGEFSKEDYAVFCQSAVLHVLIRVMDAVKKQPETAIDVENRLIQGYELHEIAAVGMLDFMSIVDRQSGHPNRPKDYFKRSYATMSRWVEGDLNSFAKWDM
ncbi:MAG: helix-turn-helix transcriptional regulator [Rhodobacteraceae bacterium]|jgi:transcriptional regulator with XRE-family HTH domain|nr:helix-turn-helix transcriptional regulator [Paracoccaceae bacterium]